MSVYLKDFLNVGITDDELNRLSRQCRTAFSEVYDLMNFLFNLDELEDIRSFDIDEYAQEYTKQFYNSKGYANRPLSAVIEDGYARGLNMVLWKKGIGAKHINPDFTEEYNVSDKFNIYFDIDGYHRLTIAVDTLSNYSTEFNISARICEQGTVTRVYQMMLVKTLYSLGNQFVRQVLAQTENREDAKEYGLTETEIGNLIERRVFDNLSGFIEHPSDFITPKHLLNGKEVYPKEFDTIYSVFLVKTPIAFSYQHYIYEE